MDIFTTALTRVVPEPIKPANLKVKALLKEAATGKLKEDLDHLENHEYYFAEKPAEKEEPASADEQEGETAAKNASADENLNEDDVKKSEQEINESKEEVKHLDLYV